MQLAYKRARKKINARREAQAQDRIRIGFERGLTRKFINYFSSLSKGASKALEENGFSGYEPSGEVHISGTPAIAEIVYSNGEKTVEVDIEKDSGSIVKIEEEVDLDSIPANIVEKAKSSGVDLATCQIYQAAKSSSGELEGYEFDDCELSKKDVDVDVDTLDVDVESNDSTTRDS